jgi:hypothetical protein
MNTISCQTIGCLKKTKEPYKLCFDCNKKDKIDCIECGNKTPKAYPKCYNCNMKNKHKCQTCDKMTDKNYPKCYDCNKKKPIPTPTTPKPIVIEPIIPITPKPLKKLSIEYKPICKEDVNSLRQCLCIINDEPELKTD